MTACGSPLPPRARQEIERLKQSDCPSWSGRSQRSRLSVDGVAQTGAQNCPVADAPEGSNEHAAAKIATLTRLKGIGENDATVLTHEIFYRGFRNRRELAAWVGMTPTPWASGDTQRDQGIGQDGPGWIRQQLIQMAWRWLRNISPRVRSRYGLKIALQEREGGYAG